MACRSLLVDLLVRDHPLLKKKLQRFAEIFEVTLIQPFEPFSKIIRATGQPVDVDFVFALSSGKSFESIRSRATKGSHRTAAGLGGGTGRCYRREGSCGEEKRCGHFADLEGCLRSQKCPSERKGKEKAVRGNT